MVKKKCSSLLFVALFISVISVPRAADIAWNNNDADGNWNNGANWSTGVVPTTSSANRAVIPIAAGPVFTAARTATTYRVLLWGSNGTITMEGGSLTTNNYFDIAYNATDSGTLTINSGTVTTTTTGGNFYCGRAGSAVLNIYDGALNISATFFVARDATSSATVNLAGGTITCNSFSIGLNGGSGIINITGNGTLIVNTDVRTTVSNYVSSGLIKAYNGAGSVLVDYNVTTPGKTTIKASAPSKAGAPFPENNSANVSILTGLSWTGVVEATSHNVYFGTVSPGTFQANVSEEAFNPGRLLPSTAYYWRIDEVTAGGTSTGDVWTFTTGALEATGPIPADDATNININTPLSWTEGSSAGSYNIYFGTSNPPPFAANQASTTYNPGILNTDTTYYWRVDAVEGTSVYTGNVWNFATKTSFRKGPYLIYPGDKTQMTVLWQLSETAAGSIAWGTDTSYSSGTASTVEYGTDHQHSYTITGLSPGNVYYYKVESGVAQGTGSFRTAPDDNADKVKLLVYGDTRSNPNLHDSVIAKMLDVMAADPEYQTILLHSGDWVNAADSESDWTDQFFNRSYSSTLQMQSKVPILGCMGNHEQTGQLFRKYYPSYPYQTSRFYFSFDYGPVHISVLDQYVDYAPGSAQLTWLQNDLANSDKKFKIIVLHQNGWSAGGSHPNDVNVQTRIQPLAEQYGVQVIIGGHNHYYARAVVNGIHHVTSGGGGAPLYNPEPGQPNIVMYEKTLGFSTISIDANSLEFQSFRPDGSVMDMFYSEAGEPDFTFIQATDPQMTFCTDYLVNWNKTVSTVNAMDPAFLVVTGDLLNSPGSQLQADEYLSVANGLEEGIELYNVAGNHDVHDAPSSTSYNWYAARFGNLWYSFTYGNNLFIVLETNILRDSTAFPGKDVEQMNWLTSELAGATGYDNIIVFTHHPLCVNSVNEPDAWNNIPQTRRAQLLSLFHQYGVRAVFSGHWHQNGYVRDGALELITTSSCSCPLAADLPGFRVVKVYKDHIQQVYKPLPPILWLPGDFNHDGTVDINDLYIFNNRWLDSGRWP